MAQTITATHFPIYECLVEVVGDCEPFDPDDKKAVAESFCDIIGGASAKALSAAGVKAEYIIRTKKGFFTSSINDMMRVLHKSPQEYKYYTRNANHISLNSVAMISLLPIFKADDSKSFVKIGTRSGPIFYDDEVMANMLNSFIMFLRGKKEFIGIWSLGLIDPCTQIITSTVNIHNENAHAF